MICALMLAVALASAAAEGVTREESRFLMGTIVVVRAQAPDEPRARAAVRAAWSSLATTDSLLSTWRDDSDLAAVNREAGEGPVRVDPRTAAVIAAALDLATASGGAFDPTVLPLMRAWGFRDGRAREPGADELAAALGASGFGLVRLDRTASTVRFLRPGVELDLGGIAKGYAVDAAIEALVAAGATGGMVDLGGSVRVLGAAATDSIGIVAPDGSGEVVACLAAGDRTVATSGQYERYLEVAGRRIGHILDPRTGQPVPRSGSVTVAAHDGMLADALATALFVLGPTEGARLAAQWPRVSWVFVLPDGQSGWSVVSGASRDAAAAP